MEYNHRCDHLDAFQVKQKNAEGHAAGNHYQNAILRVNFHCLEQAMVQPSLDTPSIVGLQRHFVLTILFLYLSQWHLAVTEICGSKWLYSQPTTIVGSSEYHLNISNFLKVIPPNKTEDRGTILGVNGGWDCLILFSLQNRR